MNERIRMYKFILFAFCFFLCSPPLSINEMPMYGKQPKTQDMERSDNNFIDKCKQDFPSLDSASKYCALKGWDCMRSKDISNAIKRFNQAWLLDSTNYQSYWGMALITSFRDKNYSYAQELMEKAINLDSSKCETWFDYGVSNMDLYMNETKNKNEKYKEKAIESFTKCISKNCDKKRKIKSNKFINYLLYPGKIQKFSIIYHFGENADLKTVANSGCLEILSNSVVIEGDSLFEINFQEINEVKPYSMPGLGSMIKLRFNQTPILISVVRLNLFGQFVIVNRMSTINIFRFLRSKI